METETIRKEPYIILPLQLPNAPSLPADFTPATHYLYVRRHGPDLRHYIPDFPDSDIPRSIYASNVPFDATEHNLRRFSNDHLGGSKVERVEFCADDIIHGSYAATTRARSSAADRSVTDTNAVVGHKAPRGKKRKRRAGEESLDEPDVQLPGVLDEELLLRSGACAVLVFVDKASADMALRAAQKLSRSASKKKQSTATIEWDSGRKFGSEYLLNRFRRQFPAREDLLQSVNEYLARYDALEETRKRALVRARTVPDADGFVTVTRGARVGPARLEQAKEALRKQEERDKKKTTDNFYRFQFREKAKEKERELRQKFEQDVRAVQKMRDRRKGKSWVT